jgi:hypothetical protein
VLRFQLTANKRRSRERDRNEEKEDDDKERKHDKIGGSCRDREEIARRRCGTFVAQRAKSTRGDPVRRWLRAKRPTRALFSSTKFILNFIMQKEDSSSHQNIGICMEY